MNVRIPNSVITYIKTSTIPENISDILLLTLCARMQNFNDFETTDEVIQSHINWLIVNKIFEIVSINEHQFTIQHITSDLVNVVIERITNTPENAILDGDYRWYIV